MAYTNNGRLRMREECYGAGRASLPGGPGTLTKCAKVSARRSGAEIRIKADGRLRRGDGLLTSSLVRSSWLSAR